VPLKLEVLVGGQRHVNHVAAAGGGRHAEKLARYQSICQRRTAAPSGFETTWRRFLSAERARGGVEGLEQRSSAATAWSRIHRRMVEDGAFQKRCHQRHGVREILHRHPSATAKPNSCRAITLGSTLDAAICWALVGFQPASCPCACPGLTGTVPGDTSIAAAGAGDMSRDTRLKRR
jgi:hypothetical protein